MSSQLSLLKAGCTYIYGWPPAHKSVLDHNHFKVDGIDADKVAVLGVVDHHVDEGLYKDAKPRIVEPCGSCVRQTDGFPVLTLVLTCGSAFSIKLGATRSGW
jgi:hypothetical protein